MDEKEVFNYTVRPAQPHELRDVLALYEGARQFMRESGNPDQWGDHYPPRDMIEEDVAEGRSLLIVSGDEICGVFCMFEGDDPTYAYIEDGAWLSDRPYVTIHRIAAKRGKKGIVRAACDYARKTCGHLRADTHVMNRPMRGALTKYGFTHCGTIYVRDHLPRMAFEFIDQDVF